MRGINGIPVLGLGTFGRGGFDGARLMLEAVRLGYRHIDTAQGYGNEAGVREAMRASGLPRKEFFVTTKVAGLNLARGHFMPSLLSSLTALGLEQIDLTLIHWPSEQGGVPMESYLEDLAAAQERGLTRLIGVSNFPVALIDRAEKILGAGKIAANQVEVHPYLQNRKLRAHCQQRGIAVTAYMPLAKGKAASDPAIQAIAAKHGAAPAAVTLKFLLDEDMIVIPASSRIENLAANLQALDVTLDESDRAAFRALERGERLVNPKFPPDWDV